MIFWTVPGKVTVGFSASPEFSGAPCLSAFCFSDTRPPVESSSRRMDDTTSGSGLGKPQTPGRGPRLRGTFEPQRHGGVRGRWCPAIQSRPYVNGGQCEFLADRLQTLFSPSDQGKIGPNSLCRWKLAFEEKPVDSLISLGQIGAANLFPGRTILSFSS